MRLAAVDPEEAAEAAEAGGDYALLARMGAGLFALQQCALVLGHLWFVGDLGVRKRILLLLHQQARPARAPPHGGRPGGRPGASRRARPAP